MLVNHGGEPGGQKCNILDNHPKRRKLKYNRGKSRVAPLAKPAHADLLDSCLPLRHEFRKPMYITPKRTVRFGELPQWIVDTMLEILLDKYDDIKKVDLNNLQIEFTYILGYKVPFKRTKDGNAAVEVSVPGTELQSVVTVNDVISCLA